ncbi:hypothetical protein GCM10012320_34840 [Sinomonas cellulolyticus]|uniref:Histidine kinase n=1 Tax=Sinomonas cellulolyticus TaxID=2801916 RepID=A0ABS1K5M3_9MICC|nr:MULTISPECIES: hypothetical protein [Sinomonas]MBL0706612.1 hypothetical protein [Sinomonas cellulolyticus]GHG60311.1 hypothetical protein GCM10012320_34840 [Sinomonas sp. KCTC 49339]
MNIDVHLLNLSRQLADAAALGGDEMVELAERLAAPLQASARLVLQDALSEAMQELTLELAPGSAELRLRGRDIDFVVNRAPATGGAATEHDVAMAPLTMEKDDAAQEPAAEAGTARISFRPPEALKAQIETAAEREGLSVNAFLVRTLTAALRPAPQRPLHADPGVPEGRNGSRLEGWVY